MTEVIIVKFSSGGKSNIGSRNGLVPSGIKPLIELMLTMMIDLCRH